jgi:hypothetical protein
MQTSDALAIVAAVVVAILSGALVVALVSLRSALVSMRAAADMLREETLPLVAELHRAVADTVEEVERVDRIITATEAIGDRVDGASRLAYRALGSPVVKAMAFGAGISQATRRLRTGAAAAAWTSARRGGAANADATMSTGASSEATRTASARHRRRRAGSS